MPSTKVEIDFAALALCPLLLKVVEELGYNAPTPIQSASIPVLLAGKDLIGQAKTGSGKTAAFALPILQSIALERRRLQALVVCPTRELSSQVAREFRKLGRRHPGLQVLVVAGGEPIRAQTSALTRGVHIAVGTPGRLLDHLQRRTLALDTVTITVLDEADRMLGMGFQEDMEKILHALPKRRQTAFFSATFPRSIEEMSRAHQRDAVRIALDEPEDVTPEIRQLVLAAEPEKKLHALLWALGNFPHDSTLVFCNFKATVADVSSRLSASGISADCLHGDLDQFHRDQVLAMFRNQSVRVLIATDVAARGIDVEDLDLVINFEMPQQPEIYLHRIGRTGRAGKLGQSISLAGAKDRRKLKAIEDLLGSRIETLPRLSAREPGIAELAKSIAGPAPMDTILISGGRKDKVRPGDILGALTGEAGGLDAKDIGKIEIHDRLTYVAVASNVSHRAVRSLNNGRIKGKRFRATRIQRETSPDGIRADLEF